MPHEKPRSRTLIERFREKVQKTDGCWLWTASTTSTGYGQINHEGRNRLAHRLAWEFAHGEPVPARLCVLHPCDVRRCVNPAHLYVGTKQQNAIDTHGRGRWYYVPPGQGRRRGPPRKRGPKRIPIAKRFWPKVDVREADDCWVWLGGIDAKGYGRITEGGREGRRLKTHRVSW